jgi:predicted ATPase
MPQSETRTRWLAAVAEVFPDLRRSWPELPSNPPLPPDQAQMRLFQALAGLVLATAAPRLLFLDDLYLADTSTLEFLEYLASCLAEHALLILGTLRVEEVGASESNVLNRVLRNLKQREILHRLSLVSLSPEAVAQLLREVSGESPQVAACASRFYQESEGNPLFLVSLLQSTFEEGWLVADETGKWTIETETLARLETSGVPPTIHQIVARRLRHLDREQRRVLEAAAVLGREFQRPVLARMRAWRGDVLFDLLDQLVSAFLLREEENEDFVFSHAKIRQVVYAGIVPEQRAWLHHKAGQALEAIHAERLDEMAAALAFHFCQANAYDQAFDYWMRAGDHAARIYALSQAAEHYRAALDLVGRDGFAPASARVAKAYERLGDLAQIAGQYAAASEEFRSALNLAAEPAARVRLLYKLAHNHDRQGQRDLASELFAQAVAEIDRLGVEQVGALDAAKVYARWAIFNSPRHGLTGAEQFARRALNIIEQNLPDGAQRTEALPWSEYDAVHTVLNETGEAFRYWGRWSEAAAIQEQSLAVAMRQGDLVGIGYASHNLGDVTLALGEFAQARALYRQAAESFGRAAQAWEQMASFTHLGLTWLCEARWEEALESLERARQIGENIQPTHWLAEVYLWLAVCVLHQPGQSEKAQAYRERAQVIAQAVGQPVPAAHWALAQSAAEAARGHLDAAQAFWAESQSLFQAEPESAMYRQWILPLCQPR